MYTQFQALLFDLVKRLAYDELPKDCSVWPNIDPNFNLTVFKLDWPARTIVIKWHLYHWNSVVKYLFVSINVLLEFWLYPSVLSLTKQILWTSPKPPLSLSSTWLNSLSSTDPPVKQVLIPEDILFEFWLGQCFQLIERLIVLILICIVFTTHASAYNRVLLL